MTLTDHETAGPDVRLARARTARATVPAESHAEFPSPLRRADPLALLARQDRDRVPELRPLRYGRMAVSPLAYFRGAALPAAADLSMTPRTGFGVQACGDAQLANFGLFPAQGRRLVFDFADFGETLPAPWEWDVKRLAASFEVTGRENGHATAPRRRTVLAAVEAYRLAMHDFARRTSLDIFFAPADPRTLRVVATHRLGPGQRPGAGARRFTEIRDGQLRLAPRPPSVVPAGRLAGDGDPATLLDRLGTVLTQYRRTLGPARRALLDRYRLADAARTVTGPGDAGTRCWVALLAHTGTGDPLFLQLKEARPSVLQGYTGGPVPGGPGRRVATGQRLIQATGDVFLGWARAEFDGRAVDFHVRRLRDQQATGDVTTMTPDVLRAHARLCGWTLARAHARTGDALAIAAYLGSGPAFAEAVQRFAVACADQNERDHAALRQAIRRGHITAAAAS
ncbi:DUF2252 domain-containing protein [Amycolatopsis sp. NPDC005003]